MGSFADDLKRFEKKTRDKMDEAVRKLSLDVFSSVIDKSPIDEGRFKGNWQPQIGSPATGIIDTTDENAAMPKVKSVTASMKAGDVIYLANNLPYAMRLEEGGYPDGPKVTNGRSSQAPNGMVALTVQEFQGMVDSINAEFSRL